MFCRFTASTSLYMFVAYCPFWWLDYIRKSLAVKGKSETETIKGDVSADASLFLVP